MILLFDSVAGEELSYRKPRVLPLYILLNVVSSEPVVKCEVLFQPCVVHILEVDRIFVKYVPWLTEPLIHIGHIIVLLVVYHILYLLIGHEKRWCLSCLSVFNPEALWNCYYTESFLQSFVSQDIYVAEPNFTFILVS